MNQEKNKKRETTLKKIQYSNSLDKLVTVMSALRDPMIGCPWDKEQTYQSLLSFTIEEVYEVVEAIENQDYDSLKEELGDLLFQIIFYAQLAKEEKRFSLDDIINAICEKLIRRHPHVFKNDCEFDDQQAMNTAWELEKQKERQNKVKPPTSVLDDIPKALPELKRAHKIQKRVANVGFDWKNIQQVWDKVAEESVEVKQAANSDNKLHLEEELGDLLFAMVNLTRHYGVDADIALRKANKKFETRYRYLESQAEQEIGSMSLEQLETLWQQAKKATQQGYFNEE